MRRSSLTKLYTGSGRAIIERNKYMSEYKSMAITVFWNLETCRQHILGACRRRIACHAPRTSRSARVWVRLRTNEMTAGRYTPHLLPVLGRNLNSTQRYPLHSRNSIGVGINNLYGVSRHTCGLMLSRTKGDFKRLDSE